MCGIYGLIFHSNTMDDVKKRHIASELFSNLAVYASERGTDATGVARVDHENVHIYKNIKASTDVVGFKRWWGALLNTKRKTYGYLGHTRFGTHGDNTIDNAHPFRFEGAHHVLVGTHNGVISNYENFGPTPPFDNDSANLFYGLSQTPQSEWGKLLASVRGSYAVVFSTDEGIFMARNYGSPCVLAYCPELDATVYASTELILKQSVKDTQSAKLTVDTVRILAAGYLYHFKPHQMKIETKLYDTMEMPTLSLWPSTSDPRTKTKIDYGVTCDSCDKVYNIGDLVKCDIADNWYVCFGCLLDQQREEKEDLSKEFNIKLTDEILCQHCNEKELWKDIWIEPGEMTTYYCRKCADKYTRYAQAGYVMFDDLKPEPCEWCRANYYRSEMVTDPATSKRVCRNCFEMFTEAESGVRLLDDDSNMLAVDSYMSAAGTKLICDNCNAMFTFQDYNETIFHVEKFDGYLCSECLQLYDVRMPRAAT